jgi:predicted O-methyltransferase YrrM
MIIRDVRYLEIGVSDGVSAPYVANDLESSAEHES